MSHGAGVLPTFTSDGCKQFYEEKVTGTDESRYDIFKNTRGQASNPAWFVARTNRVSASKARKVAFARDKSKSWEYFFGLPFDHENLCYGRETEPEARAKYAAKIGTVVHESGLFICRHFPWLAASPDGLVVTPEGDIIVLEIKCPPAGRDKDYIVNFQLKKGHSYYAQGQASAHGL